MIFVRILTICKLAFATVAEMVAIQVLATHNNHLTVVANVIVIFVKAFDKSVAADVTHMIPIFVQGTLDGLLAAGIANMIAIFVGAIAHNSRANIAEMITVSVVTLERVVDNGGAFSVLSSTGGENRYQNDESEKRTDRSF